MEGDTKSGCDHKNNTKLNKWKMVDELIALPSVIKARIAHKMAHLRNLWISYFRAYISNKTPYNCKWRQ